MLLHCSVTCPVIMLLHCSVTRLVIMLLHFTDEIDRNDNEI